MGKSYFNAVYALAGVLAMMLGMNVVHEVEPGVVPYLGYTSMILGFIGFLYQNYLYWHNHSDSEYAKHRQIRVKLRK